MTTSVRPDDAAKYRAAPLFSVSLGKLALLSICTFGIYEWYWFRNQWRSERQRKNEDLHPVWRALLAPFYGYSLFRRIQELTRRLGVPARWPAFSLGLAYCLLTVAWILPLDSLSLISPLSFVPLLVVQHSVNKLHRAVAPEVSRNDKYSAAELALLVFGAILRLLVLWAEHQLGDILSILGNPTY